MWSNRWNSGSHFLRLLLSNVTALDNDDGRPGHKTYPLPGVTREATRFSLLTKGKELTITWCTSRWQVEAAPISMWTWGFAVGTPFGLITVTGPRNVNHILASDDVRTDEGICGYVACNFLTISSGWWNSRRVDSGVLVGGVLVRGVVVGPEFF